MESKIKEKMLWYKGYNYFIKGDYDKAKEVYTQSATRSSKFFMENCLRAPSPLSSPSNNPD